MYLSLSVVFQQCKMMSEVQLGQKRSGGGFGLKDAEAYELNRKINGNVLRINP